MNNYSGIKISWVCLWVLFVAISGCSGGGGGGGGALPANSAPAITAGCANTNQANSFMGMLVATDMETPNAISFSLDVNNPMATGPIQTTNGGMVVLTNTTTGAFTYTPPTQNAGPRGRDTFRFRVDDPSSFSTATETVIVNPKIMPLGNSITFGTGSVPQVSYRLQLLNRLTDANQAGGAYQIKYVGEESSGANLLPAGQRSHAGYGGCQDQHIANGGCPAHPELTGIFAELNANPADIVLLHIGTNQPTVFDTAPDDVEAILNEIGRWEDSANGNPVSVVVMQIINQMPNEPNVATYNANVIARINSPASGLARPDQIIFGAAVDMYTAFGGATPTAALYSDTTHPNAAGYNIMGNILYSALTGPSSPAILQRCP